MTATELATRRAFEQFRRTLHAQGLRPALAYLSSLTDFRFIALFRFNGERANAAAFYDREHPTRCREAPVKRQRRYWL